MRENNSARLGRIKSPQNLIGGLLLIALSCLMMVELQGLPIGTLRSLGPAMFPIVLSCCVLACGVALIGMAMIDQLEGTLRVSLRGPFFIVLAIVIFAATVRSFGLILAAPLTMMIGGFATPEARAKELVIFSVVTTMFCILLFNYCLNQPIPVLRIPGTEIYY